MGRGNSTNSAAATAMKAVASPIATKPARRAPAGSPAPTACPTRTEPAIPMPSDVVCATEFSPEAHAETRGVDAVESDEMILDVGPQTREEIGAIIRDAGTVVWNGPLGVFEIDQFGGGTEALARAIADSKAFSLAGGGDTLAAIEKYGVGEQISYISTGGGAFLEFLEGKKLPAVAILEERANA